MTDTIYPQRKQGGYREQKHGWFSAHDQSEESVIRTVRLQLGGSPDWKIEYNTSGLIVNWVATRTA